MKLTKVQKVAAKAALVAAGDKIASNKKEDHFVCHYLDSTTKEFFLQIYERMTGDRYFSYFDVTCSTFDRASNFVNKTASEHRLIAISLAITLLQDSDWDKDES